MSVCADRVFQLASDKGVALSEDEAKLLIKNFEKELKTNRPMSATDEAKAFEVAYNKTTDMRLAARQQKREAMIKLIKFKSNEARIKKYVADGEGKYDEADALSAILVGDSTLVTGSRNSVASQRSGLELLYTKSLDRQLGDELMSIFRKGDLDEEITLLQYDRKADVSDQAKKIHQVLFDHANARRERKNRAGAFIGEREDFLVRQTHDRQKIAKTPREQWKTDILDLVDYEKTFSAFNSKEEIDEYLNELYVRFSTGKHHLVDTGDGIPPGSPRSINLAKKISQSRTIHFKSGTAAFEYAKKYSDASIYNRYFDGIRYDSKTIAMLETFGPNPKAMIDSLATRAEQLASDRSVVLSNIKTKMVKGQFDMANGIADIPGSITLAEVGNGIRVIENVSKLGGAVISAFGDPVFKGATLNRRTGMGFFGSYVNAFTNMVDGVSKKDRRHVMEMTNIYAEVTLGSVHTRAGATDGMPGVMSKLNETFFRWNLLQGWTINHKKGIAAAVAFDLGRYKGVAFDSLPPQQKMNLQLHEISPEEWDVISKMDMTAPESGKNFVTPDGIYNISDADITQAVSTLYGTLDVTDNMRMAYRDRLSTKIQTMLHDIADEGVVTPGEREKYILTGGGQQKGTYLGEFMRLVGQFKAFPVTVITKQLIPTYKAAGGGVKGFAAIVPMIAATTLLGYISGAAKDLLKGKDVKDPTNPAAWKDAMLRGGGLGIFGDFMFAEYSRYGRSLEQTLAGPGLGTISDAVALAHKTATTGSDVGDFARFFKSITPGANLFYTEAAANYLLFNGLMEMSDPGYLRRQERKLRREYKQEYWLSPSSAF